MGRAVVGDPVGEGSERADDVLLMMLDIVLLSSIVDGAGSITDDDCAEVSGSARAVDVKYWAGTEGVIGLRSVIRTVVGSRTKLEPSTPTKVPPGMTLVIIVGTYGVMFIVSALTKVGAATTEAIAVT